jgi:hypothetical protein
VVVYLPEGGLSDIWRKTIGVLVVDAEEEGGDGVLLADGKEDGERTKEMCGGKGGRLRAMHSDQRAGKPVKFVMVLSVVAGFPIQYTTKT